MKTLKYFILAIILVLLINGILLKMQQMAEMTQQIFN